MPGNRPHTIAVLGSGGKAPRVEVYHTDSGQLERLVGLLRGHSVYAADRSAEGRSLAVGSRKGKLLWIELNTGRGPASMRPVAAREQGAPVLAIRFVAEDRIAVSDTKCRCSLWDRAGSAPAHQLDTGHQIVCSLLPLDDSNLVGLTATGDLLFWQIGQGELIHTIRAIAPSPMSAMVRLTYWPAADALVWPADTGELVCYTLGRGDLHRFRAHEGEFYAAVPVGDDLVTVGKQDARLKHWHVGSDTPVNQQEAPGRVISMAAFGSGQPDLLLVTESGEAHVCRLDHGLLRRVRQIEGTDFRMVLGPGSDELEALAIRRRGVEATELLQSMASQNGPEKQEAIESRHRRLVELGYRHYSLALRAQQARRTDDIIAALHRYAELYPLLPDNDPNACDWLMEYADLLEAVWLLTSAKTCYQRLCAINQRHIGVERARGVAAKLEALQGGACVIEPGVDIPLLIEAAGVVGECFRGRFVVDQFPPRFWRAALTPKSIFQKYEQVRRESGDRALPSAMCVSTTWLGGNASGPEEVELIIFSEQEPSDARWFQFALKTLDARGQTLTTLVLLFNADHADLGQAPDVRNRRALDVWNRDGNTKVQKAWRKRVLAAVSGALGMLENEARAPLTL